MKTFFIALIACSITLFSCKNDEAKTSNIKADSTIVTAITNGEKSIAPSTSTNGSVPSFKDPDVTAFVKVYEENLVALRKAAETKDKSKMEELNKTAENLSIKTPELIQKLATNPEDLQKLSDYLEARNKEVEELNKKLTNQ